MPSRLLSHPRAVAGTWAVWTWGTTASYAVLNSGEADPVSRIFPFMESEWVWGFAATLLTLGTFLPVRFTGRAVPRLCRGAGLVIVIALLSAWAATLLSAASTTEVSVWWGVGKNYIFLTVWALVTTQIVGRDHPIVIMNPKKSATTTAPMGKDNMNAKG